MQRTLRFALATVLTVQGALLPAAGRAQTGVPGSVLPLQTGPQLGRDNTFGGVLLSAGGSRIVGQTFTAPTAPATADGSALFPTLRSWTLAVEREAPGLASVLFRGGLARIGSAGAIEEIVYRPGSASYLTPSATGTSTAPQAPLVPIVLTAGAQYLAFLEVVDSVPGFPPVPGPLTGLRVKYATADSADTYAGGGAYFAADVTGPFTRLPADLSFQTQITAELAVIPEPSTVILLGVGLVGALGVASRRRNST
jgi:hypothetical protein